MGDSSGTIRHFYFVQESRSHRLGQDIFKSRSKMANVALLLLGVGLCLVSTTHGWRYGRSSTCAFLYMRGDNSGNNLKITKGNKEDGKNPRGMARNYIRFSRTKSVKVKKGCTLELFG